MNSWITDEEYVDEYRYLNPNTQGFTYRRDCNQEQKARLDYCLVSCNLTERFVDLEHKFTSASDHATIMLEVSTDIEIQGKGTFRAPPFIQNDPIYTKLAEECILNAQLKYKSNATKVAEYIKLVNDRKDTKQLVEIPTYVNYYDISTYINRVEEANEILSYWLSLEPTAGEINKMPNNVAKKGTELEMVLMELKTLTTNYAKTKKISTTKLLKI